MEKLSEELERYFEENVKRHQTELERDVRILRTQLAPVIAKLRDHAVIKRLGLDFEEPILPGPSIGLIATPLEFQLGSLGIPTVIPIILDNTIWKCEQTSISEEMGHTPYRIHLNADHSEDSNACAAVKVFHGVKSKTELPEPFRDFAQAEVKCFLPGMLGCELFIRIGPSGLDVHATLFTDCYSLMPQIMAVFPVVKLKSEDIGSHILVPAAKSWLEKTELWRLSYTAKEKERIKELDGKKEGIRYKVERILKYASRAGSSSPLALLDPYVYTNAVLTTGQHPQWKKNDLGAAFRMTLTYLKDSLGRRVLNRYFEPEHNLLATVSQIVLQHMIRILTIAEERRSYDTLLCRT